jgi:hypothetical protein
MTNANITKALISYISEKESEVKEKECVSLTELEKVCNLLYSKWFQDGRKNYLLFLIIDILLVITREKKITFAIYEIFKNILYKCIHSALKIKEQNCFIPSNLLFLLIDKKTDSYSFFCMTDYFRHHMLVKVDLNTREVQEFCLEMRKNALVNNFYEKAKLNYNSL